MSDERRGDDDRPDSGPLPVAATLELLRKAAGRALTGREILENFTLDRAQRQALLRVLDEWVRDEVLEPRPGQRYALARKTRLASGILSLNRGGFGFVARGEGQDDIFVPARNLGDAMDGDRVVLLMGVSKSRFGSRPEGRVLCVVERARQEILGRFVPGAHFGRLLPLVPRIGPAVLIPPAGQGGVLPGQIAIARIDNWSGVEGSPVGTITSILGDPSDPSVDVLTIVYKHQLPTTFPDPVLAAAEQIPEQVLSAEAEGRIDLRELPLVTIDGETARDFDDAVAVQREGAAIRLWVAIADVGHYVAEGGILDQEALSRGTSVYFTDRCLPMLPERLSNGICSLNPGVDRLVMVAEMVFSSSGERLERKLYPAIMRSRARLTYTQVHAWLSGEAGDGSAPQPELLAQAQIMQELALRLTAMRRARGSIDFDLPEAEIVLDLNGRPEDIVRRERNIAHRLIEEFMLAANEAVADYLAQRELPLLYRVHEPPDMEKMAAVQEFAAHFNYGLVLDSPEALPHALQGLLAETEGKPEARAIHQLMLRSMKQAVYSPENVGHFGLAAERYCHFTSPIRRYPDLVVHRVLRRALLTAEGTIDRHMELWRTAFPALGEALSSLERRAMEAEREMLSVSKCRFMVDKVGEEFDGIVSGVQPFGLFVELNDWFVEGLIAIAALDDDYYEFDPLRQTLVGQRQRRTFRIGDALKVRVAKVNVDWREIDFALVEPSGSFLLRRLDKKFSGRRRHSGR